jgi:hypothetical protein
MQQIRTPEMAAASPLLLGKTLLPLPGHWTADAELGGDLLHWPTSGEGEDHLRPLHALSLAIPT